MKNTTPAEKLKLARKQKGYKTAATFARAFELSETTYRSHENGIRSIPLLTAQKYANLLQINWQWLLFNDDNISQNINSNNFREFKQEKDNILSYNLNETQYNSNTQHNNKSITIKYLSSNFYKNNTINKENLHACGFKTITVPIDFFKISNTNSNLFAFNIDFKNYYIPLNANIIFDSNNLAFNNNTENLYLLATEKNLYIKKLTQLPLNSSKEVLVNYNGIIVNFNDLNIIGKIVFYSFML
jgi:DNA-binding XRE family transcriptional regulator